MAVQVGEPQNKYHERTRRKVGLFVVVVECVSGDYSSIQNYERHKGVQDLRNFDAVLVSFLEPPAFSPLLRFHALQIAQEIVSRIRHDFLVAPFASWRG